MEKAWKKELLEHPDLFKPVKGGFEVDLDDINEKIEKIRKELKEEKGLM